ncbi:MAG: beta-lactamase family protein [Gemmatimonadetes bacterium]|nr:beta-lactamase family protein [Gemmatimonadota bacterium]
MQAPRAGTSHEALARDRILAPLGMGSTGLALTGDMERRLAAGHNGGTGGYRSLIGFDPDGRHGVVILSNANVGVDDLGFYLVSPAFPLSASN